jgi:selenide, water dikinase
VLSSICPIHDPNLLVGFETSDDAAVYRISPDMAIISTVDFITPPVDDPVWFGRIAAANALSDVYAMGGKPLVALNLVMYPSKKLDMGILKGILTGGFEKVQEAGASLAGGHSVDDLEPKYGLAVTGSVHPDKVFTNANAKPGDALVLTKPLGTGVLFNACRSKKLPFRELEKILPKIAMLNKTALEVSLAYDVHSCTDITGFGIMGHTFEMAKGSAVRIELSYDRLPFHPDALEMYRKGESTGSNKANRTIIEGFWEKKRPVSRDEEELLFDPQTSGGLLFSLPASQAEELVKKLKLAGVEDAVVVGEAYAGEKPAVVIR